MSKESKPFAQLGNTIVVASASTAPAGIRAPASGRNNRRDVDAYQFVNDGDDMAFIGWGASAVEAKDNAVAPTAGSPKPGIPIAPGTVVVLTMSSKCYFSSYSASDVTIYITPGEGM